MLGPIVLIVPFLVSLPLEFEIGLWVAVWLFICRHNYILHNHVHRPFTTSKFVNRLIGVLLGFCTGMTTGIWKITHVHGHHVEDIKELARCRAYAQRFKIDETEKFTQLSAIKHALKTAPIQLTMPVYTLVRKSVLGGNLQRRFYRYYLLEFLFIYGLVACFFIINPVKAFCYFGIIYSLVYLVSRHVDYVTHISCQSDSPYSFANVCLHPYYNKILWNFGFHVAHHLHPTAHWTNLPSIYHNINAIEEGASTARTVNFFGLFAPLTFHWNRIVRHRPPQ